MENVDVNAIPDVPNLKDFVASTVDAPVEPPTNGQGNEPVKVDGKTIQFKTLEDAFRAYQEVQGFAARTAQEKKDLEAELRGLREQVDLMRYQPAAPAQQTPQAKDFDTQFIQSPEQTIDAKVDQRLLTARIADVLEAEQTKDQPNFMERYQYAQRVVAQMYPQLGQTPAGIRKAFELGDRIRQDEMRKQAERTIKLTFGEDVDMEKFKALIKKDGQPSQTSKFNQNLAYMPDTGLHSGSRPQTGNTGIDAQTNDAMAKGDVDTVIANTFKKVLAST